MDHAALAQELVELLGGSENILACNVCMTRLRITLADATSVDVPLVKELDGVLGVVPRSAHGLEVVFGPGKVDEVHDAVCAQLGSVEDSAPPADVSSQSITVEISPARRHSYAAQAAALAELLGEGGFEEELGDLSEPEAEGASSGPKLLVINGPNINLLGLREPDVYGSEDYDALVAACRKAALDAGFSECRVYQSNHEGDLVDRIQRAHGRYDGIVINPAAYTHTSIALLDALRAVQIPAVEVHLSDVSSREDYRQISYVREWCFETISGNGVAGYVEAIYDLADRLASDAAEG